MLMFLQATSMCPPLRRSRSRLHPRACARFPPGSPVRWPCAVSPRDRKLISGCNPSVSADTVGMIVPDLHGSARRARRLSAQTTDGRSRRKTTVPTAPAPVHFERGDTARADPGVDTFAATPAPSAGQRRQ